MTATNATTTPAQLSAIARECFRTGGLAMRTLQHLRPHICPFEELLPEIPEGARVLDIGCGGGLLAALVCATRRPARFVGFDSSAPAIAVAQANVGAIAALAGVTPEFLRLDVGAPWPAGPFDCVTMIDVLHHIPPPAQRGAIEMALRAVEPGGRFVYKDMTRRDLPRRMANQMHDLVMARQWVNPAPIDDVVAWATAAGARLVRRGDFNRYWYGHELAVFERVR
ncbi:MAG: class I SAM-dependent methyltransferase [Phycisphaerales bacterium]